VKGEAAAKPGGREAAARSPACREAHSEAREAAANEACNTRKAAAKPPKISTTKPPRIVPASANQCESV